MPDDALRPVSNIADSTGRTPVANIRQVSTAAPEYPTLYATVARGIATHNIAATSEDVTAPIAEAGNAGVIDLDVATDATDEVQDIDVMPPTPLGVNEDFDDPPPDPVHHTGLADEFAEIARLFVSDAMDTLHANLVAARNANGQSVAQASELRDRLTRRLRDRHFLAQQALQRYCDHAFLAAIGQWEAAYSANALSVAEMRYDPPVYGTLVYDAAEDIGEPDVEQAMGGVDGTGVGRAEDAREGADGAGDDVYTGAA